MTYAQNNQRSSMKRNFDRYNIILTKDYIKVIDYKDKTFCKRPHSLTLNNFKEWVKNNLKYEPLYNKDNKRSFISNSTENAELPYMSFCFYLCMFKNEKIPDMKEFVDMYMDLYLDELPNGMVKLKESFQQGNKTYVKDHIEGRIFRSYYSFIRELNAILIAQEIYPDACYNFQKDLDGIDVCIGENAGIASFVATARSKRFKSKKVSTRHDYDEIKLLDLPAYINNWDERYNTIEINGINLYDDTKVKKTINSFLKEL